jgi:hypothetical protein
MFSVSKAPKEWHARASAPDDLVTPVVKNAHLQIREKWRGYPPACFQPLPVRAKIYP